MFHLNVSKVDRVLHAAARLPLMVCRLRPADASAARIYKRGRWAQVTVPPCRHGARFHCADTGWACWRRMGAGHGFWTLVLVGNRMERVGCDAGTRARELRPNAGLGPDAPALTSPYIIRSLTVGGFTLSRRPYSIAGFKPNH
jgi:hypothetical protein